jgi:hypothetical protein
MTKIKVFLIFIFCFLLMQNVYCYQLHINIVHREGIDKGLMVVSEFHAIESIIPGKNNLIEMNNGILLISFFKKDLKLLFNESAEIVYSNQSGTLLSIKFTPVR